MKKLIFISLIVIPATIFSQTKEGGFFGRVDDPIYAVRDAISAYHWAKHDSLLNQCYTYGVKPTLAIICEYQMDNALNLEPYMKFFPEKDSALKVYQDSGYYLSMHSINHSTNYYISHIDSLSMADQYFVDNGYSETDGIDTIIINNDNDSLLSWHWKRLPDDHYSWFAYDKLVDADDADDSIWYPKILPPKSVFISIYPNVAGLKKILVEQKRRFALSGLDEPDVFIHPGQEPYYTGLSDTLIESIGYIETSDDDTVIYHVQTLYSSQNTPIANYDQIEIYGDAKYNVTYVSGNGSQFTLVLDEYTGDDAEHNVKLIPIYTGNWMWFIDGETMRQVANDMRLKISAIYAYGRQYQQTGYTSSTNKKYIKYAHQWGQLLDISKASRNIKWLAEAKAKNYFAGTNDHMNMEGGTAYLDSIYNFIDSANIRKLSFRDLADSVYDISVPYENILPSFDTDLNWDEIQDGWTNTAANTWTRSGVNILGDTTYMTISSNGKTYCYPLWGLEKGDNVFAMYIKAHTATSATITVQEFKHRLGADIEYDTIRIDTLYITNLTGNYCERYKKINISKETDFIKLQFSAISGDYYATRPKMMKYTPGRNYYE